MRVPEQEGSKYGFRQHEHVKFPEEDGGGFPASINVLHHSHCLVGPQWNPSKRRPLIGAQNLLRQTNYFNFEYYNATGEGSFINSGDVLKSHIGLCIPRILQLSLFNIFWRALLGLPQAGANVSSGFWCDGSGLGRRLGPDFRFPISMVSIRVRTLRISCSGRR